MSLVKSNAVQIGQSVTATNNFTLYQPSSPDGTVRLGNGNSGSVTDVVTVNSSGNVGIGTSSTGFNTAGLPLVVGSGSGNTGMTIYSGSASSGSIHFGDTVTTGGDSYSGYVNYNHSTNSMQFGTNATERMRITSDGELLIGTTTDNGAYLLQVNSQIFATNATIATSDARLKENVTPISNALDTISKITPVAFDFKQGTAYNFDKERQTGFIAQDLQVALEGEDYAESVVKECGQYLGVAYEKLIPILTKAIQELKSELDSVKAELAALKGV